MERELIIAGSTTDDSSCIIDTGFNGRDVRIYIWVYKNRSILTKSPTGETQEIIGRKVKFDLAYHESRNSTRPIIIPIWIAWGDSGL